MPKRDGSKAKGPEEKDDRLAALWCSGNHPPPTLCRTSKDDTRSSRPGHPPFVEQP